MDPNTLYRQASTAGHIDVAMKHDDKLHLAGKIDRVLAAQYDLNRVVLLDGTDRFIAASVVTGTSWTAEVSPRNIGSDNGFLKLKAWACSAKTKRAFPLDPTPSVLSVYESFVRLLLPEESRDVPSVAEDLRALIVKATRTPYIARSIQDKIATGNNYQSLNLGKTEHMGGRPNRERIMSQVEFRGRTVLDIGANTGENSRIARRFGASLVDGYEYDPYFVEIGRMVNAAAGMTRVSLFQGDCTQPELFQGMKYDIVMAFSVWVYISNTIRQVAEITDVMLFETHTLGHGMKFYYDRVLPYFPHAISLGYVEKPQDPTQSRMLVLFGSSQEAIDQLVSRQFVKVEPYFAGLKKFINRHHSPKREQVLDFARQCFEKRSEQRSFSETEQQFGSDAYFEVFLGGLHQFLAAPGKAQPDNIHLRFLVDCVMAGLIDPNLKTLVENPAWLQRKIANRYEDAVNILNGDIDRVAPLEVNMNTEEPLSFTLTGGEQLNGALDGHHRLFMALLCGREKFHVNIT
jgi:SAM-dependent methyltransferase